MNTIRIYCDYHGFYHEATGQESDSWEVSRVEFELYKASIAAMIACRESFEKEYQDQCK